MGGYLRRWISFCLISYGNMLRSLVGVFATLGGFKGGLVEIYYTLGCIWLLVCLGI